MLRPWYSFEKGFLSMMWRTRHLRRLYVADLHKTFAIMPHKDTFPCLQELKIRQGLFPRENSFHCEMSSHYQVREKEKHLHRICQHCNQFIHFTFNPTVTSHLPQTLRSKLTQAEIVTSWTLKRLKMSKLRKGASKPPFWGDQDQPSFLTCRICAAIPHNDLWRQAVCFQTPWFNFSRK